MSLIYLFCNRKFKDIQDSNYWFLMYGIPFNWRPERVKWSLIWHPALILVIMLYSKFLSYMIPVTEIGWRGMFLLDVSISYGMIAWFFVLKPLMSFLGLVD